MEREGERLNIFRMRLVLIEDDLKLSEHLSESLKSQGHSPLVLQDQEELENWLASSLKPDLIVMDRLLGGFDTKVLLPAMKKRWPSTPVLVLSAVSTPNERADLIDMGADDYLGKPFSTNELFARLRSLSRRSSQTSGQYLRVGNLVLDTVKRVVCVEERAESLPGREFLLLKTLADDPQRIWSKEELLDYVWGQDVFVETNVVESTITNLRKKLAGLGAGPTIRNLRNAGYWIEA